MESLKMPSGKPMNWLRLIALSLILGMLLNSGMADADSSATPALPRPIAANDAELPYTDGFGLLPKLPAFTAIESAAYLTAGKQACEGQCVTPFGQVLGVADGATSYSNCVSTCIRPEFSFLDLKTGDVTVHQEDPKNPQLHYIGVTYQCVEYARKWWMKNKNITFGSIDSAYEIIYLTEGKQIRTQESFPLARSINGVAQRAPRRGDLVVYYPDREDPEWRHGHVAVVVATDLEAGTVALAEENYDNAPWQDPKAFARQIRLFNVGGRYTLLDVPVNSATNPTGGQIAGWIYPLSER